MKKPTRAIMRIDLTPNTKELFLKVADRQGMTQLAVTSRLVEWFVKQPDHVQHAILQSMFSDNQAAISKLVMTKFTS
jgi:hypothetical protein